MARNLGFPTSAHSYSSPQSSVVRRKPARRRVSADGGTDGVFDEGRTPRRTAEEHVRDQGRAREDVGPLGEAQAHGRDERQGLHVLREVARELHTHAAPQRIAHEVHARELERRQ